MNPDTTYTFSLLGSEVDLLKRLIAAQPFEQVGEVMFKLQSQLQEQVDGKQG